MIIIEESEADSANIAYDLFVGALGYEKRAIYAPMRLSKSAKRRLAVAFTQRTILNYDVNKRWYETERFGVISYSQRDFVAEITSELETVASPSSPTALDLCVDISSMSRPMIAQLFVALSRCAIKMGKKLKTRLAYCPAGFSSPALDSSPITNSEPVIPQLAGWPADSASPAMAIVGLGYEPDYALGTVENLEVSDTWAFFPTGEDKRYDKHVVGANKIFLDLIGKDKIHKYRVSDPFRCFITLESLISGVARSGRPIIIPFGPKLFAAISILVAIQHFPKVAVWRASGDQSGDPIEREASGKIIIFNVTFAPGVNDMMVAVG